MRFLMVSIVLVFAETGAHAQEPIQGLRDQDCGARQVLIGSLEGVSVYAECGSTGSDRVMNITVFNGSSQQLHAFSVGFCENAVIALVAPDGWRSEIAYGSANWTASADMPSDVSVANGERRGGFSVMLKPGWIRSRSMSVGWLDRDGTPGGAASTVTTHDCSF